MADGTWKITTVLYCTVFTDLLGFGIMIPLLPFMAFEFGGSSAALGLMATAFSLCQMVGNLTLGLASDRLGRRRVLCACLFGSAASYLAFGFASSLQMLVLCRALSGFFSGTVGCAQAYVTAAVPAKERGLHMGYISACIGAGFACGPGVGGLLAKIWGFGGPCFFSAGLCLVNALAAVLFLSEPQAATPALASRREPLLPIDASQRPDAKISAKAAAPKRTSVTLVRLLRERPHCFPVLVSTAFYYMAFAIFDAAGALYFRDGFGMTAAQFGALSTLAGLGALVIQRFCVRGTIDRLGEVWAGVLAHFIRLIAYLLVAACQASWAPYLMGLLISGGSILSPCSASLLAAMSPEDARGGVLGLNQSFAAFGRVVGPLAAAAIYSRRAEAIWYAAAAFSFFGALALLGVRRHTEEASAAPAAAAASESKATGADVEQPYEAKGADVEQPYEAPMSRCSTDASSCSGYEERRLASPPSSPGAAMRRPSAVTSESESDGDVTTESLSSGELPKVPDFPDVGGGGAGAGDDLDNLRDFKAR